ncbi:M16 family metallopeptidase [Polluticoccus soli]|uniref:M16 family metallopeptidase n=1 Tax=Polluticoccus soli TaxID=3034150 RepID=UPI0023E20E8F|nr:insulinase family protein [Flavipsychrobacter sp. JY13-12]
MKLLTDCTRMRFLAFLVLLITGFQAAFAQLNLSDPIPTDPKVLKGKFANGLTYYVRPNQKPEKKVELRLIVNAGSVLEDDDQQGLAHFMEHMNFNGTKNFEKNELVSYLQSIGVEFGADLNAYTSFDETVYILPVPTDKPGNLEKGFQIIEDWAHNALLTTQDIDEERGVVLEESRLGKGADMRMLDKYLPRLMNGSKYAVRLPIGKDEILKNFKPDVIRRFYKEWYRPNLMAVAVVGDIDTATAMKYLRQHFATITGPASVRPRTEFDAPARTKAEAMVVTDKEATNYTLQIIFPSVKQEPEKVLTDYRKFLQRELVTQMINRRLSDLVRSGNPPFPYAQASFEGWARHYESFYAAAGFGEWGLEKALTALTAEIVRARQHGFTESELDIAKRNMLAGVEKAYNERNTTQSSTIISEYIRNFLEQETMPGIENEYLYTKEMLPGIKVDEINKLTSQWLAGDNTFSLITGPEKAGVKLPTDAELVAMTQKGLQQTVQPMEEKAVASSLMEKKPVAGKVVSKNVDKDFNAVTYTLSNGIKVTVKPTDFKSDEIILTGVKKGGTNNYGVADKYSAQYAASVVNTMGLAGFTPTDLEKVMAGRNARASADIDNIKVRVSAGSSVKDIETMFQLLYLRIMEPRKDVELFNAYKQKQKMQLQFMMANPQYAFIDTTVKVLYNNNPLMPAMVPKPEHFDAINLDRAIEIYKNEVGGADGYHFFIVGNVTQEAIVPYLETYLASIPSQNETPSFKDNGVRAITGKKHMEVRKGKEPQSLIMAMWHGDIKYSEKLEMEADALAEVLNIKVIEELREKLGSIYGGGFYAQVSKEPYQHYSVGMQLPCGPENVEKLLTASREEIDVMRTKGPNKVDLDKVKSQWHEKHRTNVKENGYWSGRMEDVLFWGNDRDHVFEYDKWIDKLEPSDIKETADKLFGGNEFISVLYPEGT